MENAQNAQTDGTAGLVTAEALRELTVTPDVIYDRQKEHLLDNLMLTMVKIAQDNGSTEYKATLAPQFDPKMLAEIVDVLKELGYNVTSESKNDEKMGPFISLSIAW